MAAQLDAGTVWVNCFFVRDLAAPFGGNGHSGIGREGGTWSFDFYCDVKNSVFAPKGWARDRWVRSSARDCSRTSPRSCCREEVRRELNKGKDFTPRPRPASGCAARSSTRSTTTRSSSSTATGRRRSSSSSPRSDRRAGLFTSEELPRGMCRIPYDWPGDPELAHAMADAAPKRGTWVTAIDDPYLPVFYATVNLWHYLGRGLPDKRWISVSVCQTGDTEDFLRAGRALGDAIAATDRRVVLIASRRAVAHVLAAARSCASTRPRDPSHDLHPGGPGGRPRADRLVRGRATTPGCSRRCPSSCGTGPRRSSATTCR